MLLEKRPYVSMRCPQVCLWRADLLYGVLLLNSKGVISVPASVGEMDPLAYTNLVLGLPEACLEPGTLLSSVLPPMMGRQLDELSMPNFNGLDVTQGLTLAGTPAAALKGAKSSRKMRKAGPIGVVPTLNWGDGARMDLRLQVCTGRAPACADTRNPRLGGFAGDFQRDVVVPSWSSAVCAYRLCPRLAAAASRTSS
jgi:hypothetical protein